MTSRYLNRVAVGAALLLSLAACANEVEREDDGVIGTRGVGETDYGLYDDRLDSFLGEYVDDSEMFADDRLEYDVNDGLVTVTGELSSRSEMTALQDRIRAVPGVRDVNVDGLTVAGE